MTENEAKFEELKDAVCRLVCIAEDAICREGFEELDNAGVEIITCLDELEQYRAIGTIEEFKSLKEKADLYEQAFYLLLKDDCKRLPEGWTGSIDELYVGRKQFYLDKVEKTKVLGKIKT